MPTFTHSSWCSYVRRQATQEYVHTNAFSTLFKSAPAEGNASCAWLVFQWCSSVALNVGTSARLVGSHDANPVAVTPELQREVATLTRDSREYEVVAVN